MAEKAKKPKILESITILGKTYPLYLGFDFIRELDKKYPTDMDGFASGIGMLYVDLQRSSALGVLNFIQAATNTVKDKPSEEDIEQELINRDLGALSADFLQLFTASPLIRPQLEVFARLGQALMEAQKQEAEEKQA